MRKALAAAAALALAAVWAAPAAATGPLASACTARAGHPQTYRHVMVIVFENHSAGQIVGSPKTPYITKVARRCGWASRFHNVTHPSLPNYLAMTSGSTAGIATDCNACGKRRARGILWLALPARPVVLRWCVRYVTFLAEETDDKENLAEECPWRTHF